MALNIATLKTRSLSALIFVVVMLAGLLWNPWSFFVLFSIIHFGCWIEYEKLIGAIDAGYRSRPLLHRIAVMAMGWSFMLLFCGDYFTIGALSLHEAGRWLLFASLAILVLAELFGRQWSLKNMGYSAFGLAYISLSWGLMLSLRQVGMPLRNSHFADFGTILPMGLIAAIWINDTMAYIVGSLIGKTPFSAISPKKTWEGTGGGAILCVVVTALLGWWLHAYRIQDWIAIGAIAAVVGTAGDLFESKLKRMAGVKDSGSILPGHGGFLDRFDSLLLATPVAWVYVALFL